LKRPTARVPIQPTKQALPHIEPIDPVQAAIWRSMSPARRLELAFQAYQFALDTIRFTERRANPELSDEDLNWRITRRMQGDPRLGR